MMVAAGRALGANSPALKDPNAALLPVLTDVRQVAIEIAVAVATEAQKAGVAPATTPEELRASVIANQWAPEYDA
jgi:malate dehydrogenase (oxaloacetate-decarboxylating)